MTGADVKAQVMEALKLGREPWAYEEDWARTDPIDDALAVLDGCVPAAGGGGCTYSRERPQLRVRDARQWTEHRSRAHRPRPPRSRRMSELSPEREAERHFYEQIEKREAAYRAEIDRLRAAYDEYRQAAGVEADEADRLRAENEALREAGDGLADICEREHDYREGIGGFLSDFEEELRRGAESHRALALWHEAKLAAGSGEPS